MMISPGFFTEKNKIKKINYLNIFLSLAFTFFLCFSFSKMAQAAPNLIKPIGKADITKLMGPQILEDRAQGSPKAPVTIIEYGSLTCPHCALFYTKVLPDLRAKYIDTGKVRYIFREFPFDPLATAGFMLARCVPKDEYFPFLEVLYEQAQSWISSSNQLLALKRLAKLGGLSDEKFQACLQNKDLLQKINKRYENGISLGIKAIPTFFINDDMYEGDMSFEEMSQIIDSYLK